MTIQKDEIQRVETERDYLKAKIKLAQSLRGRYYYFFKYFWPEISKEKFVDNWSIEYICDELQIVGERLIQRVEIQDGKEVIVKPRQPKLYDLLINLPIGESKSSMISQLWNVWLWLNDPSLILITGSGADSLVRKNALVARDVITSKRFKDLFGTDAIQLSPGHNQVKDYKTTKGGRRISMSAGSVVIGEHAHAHVLDDPIDTEQMLSKASVQKVNRWIKDKLSTRFIDFEVGVTVLVMQRLAVGDPSDLLLKISDTVKHISLPAEMKKGTQVLPKDEKFKGKSLEKYYSKKGLMNAKRKGKKVLKKLMKRLGSVGYAAQVNMSPKPLEGNIIKDKNIYTLPLSSLPLPIWKMPYIWFADTSYTKKESNDPNGLLKIKFFENAIYIFDFMKFRKEASEAVAVFKEEIERHDQNGPIHIENKASGQTYAQL